MLQAPWNGKQYRQHLSLGNASGPCLFTPGSQPEPAPLDAGLEVLIRIKIGINATPQRTNTW